MGAAVKSYIQKEDRNALEFLVGKQREKAYTALLEREDDGESIEEWLLSQRSKGKQQQEEEEREAVRELEDPARKRGGGSRRVGEDFDDFEAMDEDRGGHVISSSEEETVDKPARGRGRARGAARGRATKTPVVAKPRARAPSSPKVPASRARAPSSPAKARGGRAGARGAGQSTIAAAFARSQVMSLLLAVLTPAPSVHALLC